MIYEYYHFEEIPAQQLCVKFKEHYFDKESKKYIPTVGTTYYRINIDQVESLILDSESELVTVLGMIGKFFK